MARRRVGRRPRILLVSALPPPAGGVAVWTAELLASPMADRFEIELVDRSAGLLGGTGVDTVVAQTRSGGRALARALSRMALRPPDLVHICCTGRAPGALRDIPVVQAAHRRGIPVIMHIRGSASRLGAWPAWLPLLRRGLAPVDTWLVLNATSQRELLSLGFGPAQRLHNAIPDPPLPTRDWPPADRPLRVVYVGWLKPAKGVLDLLDAVARVPGIQLELVGRFVEEGGATCEPQVRARLETPELAGRARLVGEVPREEVWDHLARADLFTLPSHGEGFPLSLLEAMTVGLPSVVTPVGAMPEAVRDGVEGCVVPVGDPEALAHALKEYATHPERVVRHGAAARARVREAFSLEAHYDGLATLWEDRIRRR